MEIATAALAYLHKTTQTTGNQHGLSPQLLIATFPSFMLLFVVCGPAFWFKPNFRVHRISGMIFLIQYAIAWYFCLTNYEWYVHSPLTWTVAFNGCVQALSAIRTFYFLPRAKVDPGYYGDKGTISYAFMVENLFYQFLTLFGCVYYTDAGFAFMKETYLGHFIELIWVFLPFVVVRPYFPKTRFRDALDNTDKNVTSANRSFYWWGVMVIKFFYTAAKHYMGFFLMYIRYLDRYSPDDMHRLQLMLLSNAGIVSIAIFLHTLRFKGMLNPRIAYSTYVVMVYFPLLTCFSLVHVFLDNWVITLLATGGLILNYAPSWISPFYQFFVMGLITATRSGVISGLV